MSDEDHRYVLHTNIECERLDRQVPLQGEHTILRRIDPAPGSLLLDAGSGSGAPARVIARHHRDVTVVGADMNTGYTRYAEARAAEEGLTNFTATVADLTALPFASNTFGTVWSQYVLYFTPDPLAVLRELGRVTQPGGEVIIRLDERTMCLNHPEDPALQPKIETLIDAILGGWENKQLPALFWEAGFTDVWADVEYDHLYTFVGAASEVQRRNVAEVLAAPIEKYADLLGGRGAAQQFLTDWVDYIGRPDTFTASAAWIVRGRAPLSDR